ncbi:hypothetical protein EMPS_08232 [Entomortierella parvispora]|uniref:Uncharacterized protein n=1 Tax=Entomortierella parvispora TaxID=205924 RepID=A0A9P3HFM6_9FUNG|nr:hypothetical protein EMPS_08232 [Entomortierella parvispora]
MDTAAGDKIKKAVGRSVPVQVLFAGWASLVLEDDQGKLTITGDESSSEVELICELSELVVADPLVKCYGWESLQGFLLASGKVVGLGRSGSKHIFLEKAKDVAACGLSADHLTVAIDKDSGHLFQWTASKPNAQLLQPPWIENIKFDRIWAGEAHLLALASNGDLYSWGSGRHGQLGHGDLVSEEHPKVIESLQGIRITSAACGSSFSIVLSETGDVYTFGLNDHGQLGIGAEGAGKSNTAFAQLIEFPIGNHDEEDNDVNIVKVACGTAHSVVIDDQGQVWSCGWGKYGQLGPQETPTEASTPKLSSRVLSVIPDQYTFQRVARLEGHSVQARGLVCGLWNTFLWT